MTIDERINKAEEDAKVAEIQAKWGIGNYFIDRTEALEYAKECRQLAKWLKELKQLREQTRWIPVTERPPEAISMSILRKGAARNEKRKSPDYGSQDS